MENIKNRIEALLFSSGKRMNIDKIVKICNTNSETALQHLQELKKGYDERGSSLMIVNEGDAWKFSVRERYLPVVQKVVTETELTKTVMETLAVIAFKYPIKQSDLINIRTNKAYDHLKELEELGYISRQRYGRTKLIKLTEKFFEYFDLPPDKLKEQFRDFGHIAKAIEEKEKEIKEAQIKMVEEAKNKDEQIKEEIENMDKEDEEKVLDTDKQASESEKEVINDEIEKKGSEDAVSERVIEEETEQDREKVQQQEIDNSEEIEMHKSN